MSACVISSRKNQMPLLQHKCLVLFAMRLGTKCYMVYGIKRCEMMQSILSNMRITKKKKFKKLNLDACLMDKIKYLTDVMFVTLA